MQWKLDQLLWPRDQETEFPVEACWLSQTQEGQREQIHPQTFDDPLFFWQHWHDLHALGSHWTDSQQGILWGFKGVQKEIPSEEACTLEIGSVAFHSDNAPVCNSILVTDYLTKMGIYTVLDLALCDFWLFPKLKEKLRGCRYETIEEMKEAVTKVIDTLIDIWLFPKFRSCRYETIEKMKEAVTRGLPCDLPGVVRTVQQVHCCRRRLLRMGQEFHVCTINKSAHTKKKVWKLIEGTSYLWMSSRSVVANVLDCDIVFSDFEFQSHYYVHFWLMPLGKIWFSLSPPSNGLNSATTLLRSFFQVAVVSILLYGCTILTLTKWLEKKLDGNYTRMLRVILNKSWRQHPTRHQLYGHLPPITKTIQVRRARHAGHCWRSRDELISDVLRWTPTYGRAKAGRPARTCIQQLCEDTGCSPEDLPEAMNDREKSRERVRDIRASCTTWW